jgi:hypothetical protein
MTTHAAIANQVIQGILVERGNDCGAGRTVFGFCFETGKSGESDAIVYALQKLCSSKMLIH